MRTSGPHLRRAFALAVALHLVAAWLLVPAFHRTPPERTPPREPVTVSMVVIQPAKPPHEPPASP